MTDRHTNAHTHMHNYSYIEVEEIRKGSCEYHSKSSTTNDLASNDVDFVVT